MASDDVPLLASPAPHVGTMMSPGPDAWKKLLVNSPPAWAASPEIHIAPEIHVIDAPEQRIPPFPWPRRDLEDEEEIDRFLRQCQSHPRTPSPRRRMSHTWTPLSGALSEKFEPSTATPLHDTSLGSFASPTDPHKEEAGQ